MQVNTSQLPLIKRTTFILLPLVFGSCGVMEQALHPAAGTETFTEAEAVPEFIEDFYSEDESPAALALDLRGELRTGICDEEAIEARQLSYNMSQMTGLEDIGGSTSLDVEENEAIIDELTEKAMENGRFVPSKLEGQIDIDITMGETSCYTFPLDQLKVNSNFGWRRGRVHAGIDLDLETGDNVYAIIDGVVKEAEYSRGYGNLVILQHENGLETYYAHLSKIKVEPGDVVESGDLIGLGGSTGRSTGPHLHFEVRYHGAYMDPNHVIDFKTGELKSDMLTLEKNTFKMLNDVNKAKYHTVRRGDTLSGIASRYGTSVSKICRLNGISSNKVIRPGQRIRVR